MPLAGLVGGVMSAGFNQVLARSAKEYEQGLAKELMQYQYQNFMSPSAQAHSYAMAGMNPALAMGPGGSGAFATPSPSYSPTPIPMLSGIDQLANATRAYAEAKKAGADTVGKNLENRIVESSLKDRIDQVGLQNNWTKEQTAKTTQEFALISGQCNEMQQRIDNMRSEKALTDKQVQVFDRRMSAEIDHLKSQADYQKALAGLTESQKELFAATMDDMKNIVYWQSQQLEKLVGLLNKYGDAQAVVALISQAVGAASDILGSISPKGLIGLGKTK